MAFSSASIVERVLKGGDKLACFASSHESRLGLLVRLCHSADRNVVVVARGCEAPYHRALELQRHLQKRVQCIDDLEGSFAFESVTVVSAWLLRGEMIVQQRPQKIDLSLLARSLVVLDDDAVLEPGGSDCAFLASPALTLYTTRQENAIELADGFEYGIWALPLGGEALLDVSTSEENWLRFKALSKRARSSTVEDDRRRDALRCAKELAGGEECCTVVCSSRRECDVLARMAIFEPTRWRSICDKYEEECRMKAIDALFLDDEETKLYAKRGVALCHSGVRNRTLVEIAIDERLVGLVVSDIQPRHGRAISMKKIGMTPPTPCCRLLAVVDADDSSDEKQPPWDQDAPPRLGLWVWLRAASSGADERRAKALVEKLLCENNQTSSTRKRVVEKQQVSRRDELRALERRRCLLLLRNEVADASGPWLQRGRLCLYEKRWVAVLERKDAATVDVLDGNRVERDVEVRKLRLSAMRVFVPSRSRGDGEFDGVSRSISQALDEMKKTKSTMLDEMEVIPVTSDFGRLLQKRLADLEDADNLVEENVSRVEDRLRMILPSSKKYRNGLKCLGRLGYLKNMVPTKLGHALLIVLAAFPDELRVLVLFQAVFLPATPHGGDDLLAAVALSVVGRRKVYSSNEGETITENLAEAARHVYRNAARHNSFFAEDQFTQSFADSTLLEAIKTWTESGDATFSRVVKDDALYEGDFVAALRGVARILPALSEAAQYLDRGDLVESIESLRAGLVKGPPFQARKFLGGTFWQ